ETGARVLHERLHLAVARGHGLAATVHHPGVGVAGAGVERGLDCRFRGVVLAHASTLGLRQIPRQARPGKELGAMPNSSSRSALASRALIAQRRSGPDVFSTSSP